MKHQRENDVGRGEKSGKKSKGKKKKKKKKKKEILP